MNIDDAVVSALWWVARRASDRSIAVLAGISYFGIGLALPIVLGWSVSWLIVANVVGTMIAGLLILYWFAALVQQQQRRNLVEWTTDLRRLDPEEFEWFVGELLRRDGWTVEETGGHGVPDGGIDLVARRDGQKAYVQCKRWQKLLVGVDDVRAFAGAVAREGGNTKSSIFVTLSEFTPMAISEGQQLGMTLWDHRDLFARAEKARRKEPCPICGGAMLLDRSSRGWWFRCVAPGCVGKRDLGRVPADAVELLTMSPEFDQVRAAPIEPTDG